MAKSLVLGNGGILVCLDRNGMVKDFYFPFVGFENHIARAAAHKIGVFADGVLSWVNEGEWKISIDYERHTMVSKIEARNHHLGIRLSFRDSVYNEKNIFAREVKVKNERDDKRDIKLYFNQSFFISESKHANTAYIYKDSDSVIHYKGRRTILVTGRYQGKKFNEYSVGLSGIEGKEGTYKDAEDGRLEGNPIENGTVDSTFSFSISIGSESEELVYYWIAIGETLKEALSLNSEILRKSPKYIIDSSGNYWHGWLEKRKFIFYGLDKKVEDVFKKSLFIARSHVDDHGGIIASSDSDILQYGKDTYSYVWPRDGAFTALALDKAGYFHIGERFFQFCSEVMTEEGYMLHKYNPDKSFGSSWHPWVKDGKPQLAIQEDETALPIFMLWEHYKLTKDLEFIEKVYNCFIKKAADFLDDYRDKKEKLPLQSYDLWEERRGIHLFTVCSVYGALKSAANFAEILGKKNDEDIYRKASEEIKTSILKHFYDSVAGYFYRSIWLESKDVVADKTIDASSAYGVYRFGLLKKDDERLESAFKITREKLGGAEPLGMGMARYEDDLYYKRSDRFPGNSWFVTTMWATEYFIDKANSEDELADAKKFIEWAAKNAMYAGVLSEQINPETGEMLSVAPLTWSHAGFILVVIKYLEKLEEMGICKTCYPVEH